MPEFITERGLLPDRDALVKSEVVSRRGAYVMVWRFDQRIGPDRRYGVLRNYGEGVYGRIQSFALQSDADKFIRGRV